MSGFMVLHETRLAGLRCGAAAVLIPKPPATEA
jgi:hypothetical protein